MHNFTNYIIRNYETNYVFKDVWIYIFKSINILFKYVYKTALAWKKNFNRENKSFSRVCIEETLEKKNVLDSTNTVFFRVCNHKNSFSLITSLSLKHSPPEKSEDF